VKNNTLCPSKMVVYVLYDSKKSRRGWELVLTAAFLHYEQGDVPLVCNDPNVFFVGAELGVVSFLGPTVGTFAMC